MAGDADEAQDHAELLLKDRSLSWYYDDEVALRGLQLAAEDAQRGVLLREQLERVKNTIKKLVSELARFRYTQVPTHDLLPLRNRILYPLGMTLADDILSLVTRKPGLTEAEMPSISLAVSAISSGSILPVAV